MSDDEALLRAISEHPEEDIPRLMYADFLDETGEAERAAFIRAQVEAARQPPWEPFPVFCRHRKPEWTTGRPWVSTLPDFPRGWNVEWGDPPFQRGFGWRVTVRSLFAWQEVSPKLFETNPIGELHLYPGGATLDDLRNFASAAWVRKLHVLKLEGGNPSEPLRALRESDVPTAIQDVYLRPATSPGLSFVISDLLQSPLGESIRGLHLRTGGSPEDLCDVLVRHGDRLERLSLVDMGISAAFLLNYWSGHTPLRHSEIDLSSNPIGMSEIGLRAFEAIIPNIRQPLTTLILADMHLEASALEVLVNCGSLASVRRLDLSRNVMRPRATTVLAASETLKGLRMLNLSKCRLGNPGVRHLTQATFWPNLVELDLRGNKITDVGAKHLLGAEVPSDLTALLIDGTDLGVKNRAALRRKFGDAVIFEVAHERA